MTRLLKNINSTFKRYVLPIWSFEITHVPEKRFDTIFLLGSHQLNLSCLELKDPKEFKAIS